MVRYDNNREGAGAGTIGEGCLEKLQICYILLYFQITMHHYRTMPWEQKLMTAPRP